MSWKTIGKKEKDLAKFLKAGTQVSVNIETLPRSIMVEGKFGKQRMYLIDTKEFGMIYVKPIKVAQIADLIGDVTTGYLVIEL